jgi:hypothetical protein
MSTDYSAIDIKYGWRGDYQISSDGDFEDTASDQIQSLVQEIQTICNSGVNDWEEHPNYAATLDDFVGEPNNRDTARRIVDRIRTTAIGNNIVRADDISVNIIPIDRSKVFIIVAITAASTPNNSVLSDGRVTVSLIYDYTEQGISFVDSPT